MYFYGFFFFFCVVKRRGMTQRIGDKLFSPGYVVKGLWIYCHLLKFIFHQDKVGRYKNRNK